MRTIKDIGLASVRALACGLVAGPLLAGCLQSDPNVRWLVADESPPWLWSREAKPRASNNTVQWTQLSHTIAFDTGKKAISREEAARIDRFLTLTRARGDTASIVVAVAETAKGKKLAADRGKAVTVFLARRGVNVGRVSEVPGSSNPDVVTVLIGRNIVQTPKCGNWRRALAGNKLPDADRRQYGCVTAASLGAHVAYPSDLVRSRPTGPADGEVVTKGVQDYRAGKFDTKDTDTGLKGTTTTQ